MMSSILVQAAPQQPAAASPVGGPTMWTQVWALQGPPGAGRLEPLLPSRFTWQASLRFPCCGVALPVFLPPDLPEEGRPGRRREWRRGAGLSLRGQQSPWVWWKESRGPRHRALVVSFSCYFPGEVAPALWSSWFKAVSQSGRHGHLGPHHSLGWGHPMHCRALSSNPGLHPPANSNSPLLPKVQ